MREPPAACEAVSTDVADVRHVLTVNDFGLNTVGSNNRRSDTNTSLSSALGSFVARATKNAVGCKRYKCLVS